MTRHPPNPKCDCDHCYVTDLNAVLRRFVEQREKGKVPVDPDAEQLAGQVGVLAGELQRGAALKPLAIDLFCGLGGWTDGLLAEGYDVIGFDIEHHQYGDHRYPAQLVVQDVRTLHGSQFRHAALIVASPPCQGYSYRAMPWKRAKALPPPCNELFETCFRIQQEACAAAGRYIPLIVENVRGAQKWVGRARWNYGSFYLWGDVPALMPSARAFKSSGLNWSDRSKRGQDFTRHAGAHAIKNAGHQNRRDGHSHTRHLTNPAEHRDQEGVKQRGSGREWFAGEGKISRVTSSKSPARKMASAMIAKIPLPLSRHIAATFKPALAGELRRVG